MGPLLFLIGVPIFFLLIFLFSSKGLIHTCAPNEVLIFSGGSRREGGRRYGYRIIKGGTGFRMPLFETVDRMDLTNMVIDVSATNAYCKGGIPLTVQGVANVKIAGHEPVLNNAIERFLGRSRMEVMAIAKATLEGSLRGILSTMTPEQVNEDKIIFAERLVHEVEADMTALGLVVDTMKIQNVHDDVKYLDSIGRRRSAEVISHARISEARAKADSVVREAENLQREVEAQIAAEVATAKAEAQRRLVDAQTRRAALVAEEQAIVMAQVAQATAEVEVQRARVEQVRRKLDADVIQPAKASAEASEASAKASTASIIEEGRARALALKSLAESWEKSGKNAREVLLMQKLNPIIEALTATIAETKVDKVMMIDSRTPTLGSGDGQLPMKAISTLEQIKQIFGVDIVEKLKNLGDNTGGPTTKKTEMVFRTEPEAPPAPFVAPPEPAPQTPKFQS
jgi:flotillin